MVKRIGAAAVVAGMCVAAWPASSQPVGLEARPDRVAIAAAAAIADTLTAASASKDHRALVEEARGALMEALTADAPLSPQTIDAVSQATCRPGTPCRADQAWLDAARVDFQKARSRVEGLAILRPFLDLPYGVLLLDLQVTETVSQKASDAQRAHAVVDAHAARFLGFLAEALGPKLGRAFLAAYKAGAIGKAAALIKASEVGAGLAKEMFRYPRPFVVDHIAPPLDTVLNDGAPYRAEGFSFPSGHTDLGYTDALLLASMLPERFVPLVDRAALYGYSRVVLNVHYPLDVIGSRMTAQRNVARYLADPAYRPLFEAAKAELRAALEKACGEPIAACARAGDAADDPWSAPQLRDFYAFTMTYGLPRTGPADMAMGVPEGAEILLQALAPDVPPDLRAAALMRTALPSGYPLDSADPKAGFWQRLDLDAAARSLTAP